MSTAPESYGHGRLQPAAAAAARRPARRQPRRRQRVWHRGRDRDWQATWPQAYARLVADLDHDIRVPGPPAQTRSQSGRCQGGPPYAAHGRFESGPPSEAVTVTVRWRITVGAVNVTVTTSKASGMSPICKPSRSNIVHNVEQ